MQQEDPDEVRERGALTPFQRCAFAAAGALLGVGCVWVASDGEAGAATYALWAAVGAATGLLAGRRLLELIEWIGLLLP